jgi:hypothetical protein
MNKTLIANESHRNMEKTHPFWMRLHAILNGHNSEHPSGNRRGRFVSMVEISSGSESNIASERANIAARRILK